ncbi:MAG: TIR domain-containing protein [Candidatus Thiodiazotropha sp. (ex Dulcina madagascariensis)]|nr:TIR domain-containing protein [Candidatus Thiodiazotropha sp. (ex Dulcina madagascariensis)]
MPKHKVFISYHHSNDQAYKEDLIESDIFIDASVDTGDIDEGLSDQAIRQKIRDEYLKDSSVTIVLVGAETKNRKHVDWEIYSSMYDGQVNKKSGVLVINLPSIRCTNFTAAHGDEEKKALYPSTSSWTTLKNRSDYEKRYPYAPSRIIDNLLKNGAKVSVTNWDNITDDAQKLKLLIDLTYEDRAGCDYDLSTPMRCSNS